ncbi:hypothetical protein NVP1029O_77 [Vibrio phage 1.029.O._10N.261.55.A7]|nr:hypothetical protein NVP1029O_77 [Vibrio phage 1.029.O._10N.261.55.A7]
MSNELKNIDKFTSELMKMAQAIYLACDAEVASDVSLKTRKAVKIINDLVGGNAALTEHLRLKEFECEELAKDKAELVGALERISKWNEPGLECRVNYGSNGQRDYYRLMADVMVNKHKGE